MQELRPSRVSRPAGVAPARCRTNRRTPLTLACPPWTVAPEVAPIWFSAPPTRFFPPPWGFPSGGPPRCPKTPQLTHPGNRPVFEVSVPRRPSPRPQAGRRLSWVSSSTAHSGTLDPAHPGGSTPRHLPSSGFDYPLDGFLPCVLGDGPSAAAAPLRFSLQGLPPPSQRYPSRGLASPVVPRDRPQAARQRLQRVALTGKGVASLRRSGDCT
jgi:hypothetical protein